MCRMTGVPPSILLHPLDFIGCDDVGDLAFFPGMDMKAADKIEIVDLVIRELRKHFSLTTMEEHIGSIGNVQRELDLAVGIGRIVDLDSVETRLKAVFKDGSIGGEDFAGSVDGEEKGIITKARAAALRVLIGCRGR